LWITGKYWSRMYNVTFTVPDNSSSAEPEPEPELGSQESITSVDSIYSELILVALLATVVILFAMNLKDGGGNPRNGGPLE
jgi:hypothetical protein